MKEERKVIEPNAIVFFNGDAEASKLNELFTEFKGDIIINGDLILDVEELIIQCNSLYVMGEITLLRLQKAIWLEGNLYVEGDIDCCDISVNGSICCMGSINSFEINVSEDLYAKSYIAPNGYDINVGGELICEDEIEAAEIVVLQKIHVKGRIEADSIRVG